MKKPNPVLIVLLTWVSTWFLMGVGFTWHSQSYVASEAISDAGTSGVLTYAFITPFVNAPICTCGVEAVYDGGTQVSGQITLKSATLVQCTSTGAGATILDIICVGNK